MLLPTRRRSVTGLAQHVPAPFAPSNCWLLSHVAAPPIFTKPHNHQLRTAIVTANLRGCEGGLAERFCHFRTNAIMRPTPVSGCQQSP